LGALLGYTTIALPQWKNEANIDLRLDENESSLYASLFWMIGIICSPIGGILSGWLGRRKIVMIASPLVICGWLIIGFAQDKIMLYIGKTICSGKYPI
jgi:MFS family permease